MVFTGRDRLVFIGRGRLVFTGRGRLLVTYSIIGGSVNIDFRH